MRTFEAQHCSKCYETKDARGRHKPLQIANTEIIEFCDHNDCNFHLGDHAKAVIHLIPCCLPCPVCGGYIKIGAQVIHDIKHQNLKDLVQHSKPSP